MYYNIGGCLQITVSSDHYYHSAWKMQSKDFDAKCVQIYLLLTRLGREVSVS